MNDQLKSEASAPMPPITAVKEMDKLTAEQQSRRIERRAWWGVIFPSLVVSLFTLIWWLNTVIPFPAVILFAVPSMLIYYFIMPFILLFGLSYSIHSVVGAHLTTVPRRTRRLGIVGQALFWLLVGPMILMLIVGGFLDIARASPLLWIIAGTFIFVISRIYRIAQREVRKQLVSLRR